MIESNKLRVCIAGVTGWVGKPLATAISHQPDLRLVGAVARGCQGRNLNEVIAASDLDILIGGSVAEALQTPTDVLVDFTSAEAVKANVMTAISSRVHVVIGSSGLTDEDFVFIEQAALKNRVGVIAAGNFALTAVLLQRFAAEAAKFLSQWEIIDYFPDTKQDAPSGTARELAFRLSAVRRPQLTHSIQETIGDKESRGASLNESQVHSIRLPGYVSSIEIIFGANDERLTIRHDAGNGAEPYVEGTLLAIRKVADRIGLTRGLDKVIEL